MEQSIMNRIKRLTLFVGTALTISIMSLPTLKAASTSDFYLQKIMEYTYGTLQTVNKLPFYLNELMTLAISWLAADDTTTTADMQASFTRLGNALVTDLTVQNTLQTQLNSDLFGGTLPTSTQLPTANDIVYSTLLNQPLFPKDPRNKPGAPPQADPLYNYIKNAAGLSVLHSMPLNSWQGNIAAQTKYRNYYHTIMAIESFDSYALSHLYAEAKNNQPFTQLQASLISQASDTKWLAQAATEELGKVLRQILIFQSQTYVILTELLSTQKQLLAAQTMNNTLLILSNSNSETLLLQDATGTITT
jgi:hypothetical protein